MGINKPVAAIIIFIINAVVIFFFLVPKYQESLDLEKELFEKQTVHQDQSNYYGKVSDILQSIESRKDVLKKVEKALPADLSLGSLIYFLQKNAVEKELIVKSISFSKPLSGISLKQALPGESDKELRSIILTINLSGRYQGLKNFLTSLEKSDRLFEVNAISFTPIQSLSKGLLPNLDNYDFKLEIKTHTY